MFWDETNLYLYVQPAMFRNLHVYWNHSVQPDDVIIQATEDQVVLNAQFESSLFLLIHRFIGKCSWKLWL